MPHCTFSFSLCNLRDCLFPSRHDQPDYSRIQKLWTARSTVNEWIAHAATE